MSYTDSQAHLNTVTTPTGDTTNYSYAVSATATQGYNDEITKIDRPRRQTARQSSIRPLAWSTHTENAEAELTDYAYTRTNCASTTGCTASHTATHPTGLITQQVR